MADIPNIIEELRIRNAPIELSILEQAELVAAFDALRADLATANARVVELEALIEKVADDVVLPRSRLIRIDTVSNTVRVENVGTAGKETLSPLMLFDGTVSGLLAMLAAKAKGDGT